MRYVVIVECTRDTDVEEENVSTVHGPFRSFEAAERYADKLQPHLEKWMVEVQRSNEQDPEHYGTGNATAYASIRYLHEPTIKRALGSLPTEDE